MFLARERTLQKVATTMTAKRRTIEDQWRAVGEAVEGRRLDLGLTQQEAAAAAEIGTTTWRKLETGQETSFRPMTKRSIAKSLGWTADSIDRLLRGEPPVEAAAAEPFRPPIAIEYDYNSRIPRMPDHVKRAIDALIAGEEAKEQR